MHSELQMHSVFRFAQDDIFLQKLICGLGWGLFAVCAGSRANCEPTVSRSARHDVDGLIGMLRILIARLVGDSVLVANITGDVSRDRVYLIGRVGEKCSTSGRSGKTLQGLPPLALRPCAH